MNDLYDKQKLNRVGFKEVLDKEIEKQNIIKRLEKQKMQKLVIKEWRNKQKDKLAGVKKIFRL